MFNDAPFRERNKLSAVNSINWARVMAQTVYYVVASETFAEPSTFVVPTGNFGNVLAGWIAREMGAPISDFVLASNTNDILTRFVNDGDMTARSVVPTLSPSMDIQVSSNFERLLFEMNGRDGGLTAEQLDRFRQIGSLDVEPDQRAAFIEGTFRAAAFDDDATLQRFDACMTRPACSSIRTRQRVPLPHDCSGDRTDRSGRWSRSQRHTRQSSPMQSSRLRQRARRSRSTLLDLSDREGAYADGCERPRSGAGARRIADSLSGRPRLWQAISVYGR